MGNSQTDDYRAAGFAGEVGFRERPALILIDLMMAYFDPSSPMYAAVENVLDSNKRLLAAAHRHRLPVFFTQQIYEDEYAVDVYVRKVPALRLLRRGSPLSELHPILPVEGAFVLIKHFPSAFYQTDLAARLRSLSIDTLIITGLSTSGCVRATAMDTLLHGFAGIVVREAVGDRDEAQHLANLFDINAKLADVLTEAEVLQWLQQHGRPSGA